METNHHQALSSARSSPSYADPSYSGCGRKRKAPPPPPASPEVQITKMVSKEDKIQHVTLSSDDENEDDQDGERRREFKALSRVLLRHSKTGKFQKMPMMLRMPAHSTRSQLQVPAKSPRENVIACLSSESWRDDNKGIWDSVDVDCTSIRIGDYQCPTSSFAANNMTTTSLANGSGHAIVFSGRGLYFKYPRLIFDNWKPIMIGLDIDDITQMKVYSDENTSWIFLKTTESCSDWIRDILGMKDVHEKSKGHYSPRSKYPCQRYLQFRTTQAIPNKMIFRLLYKRSNQIELDESHLKNLQNKTVCEHSNRVTE